MQTPSDSLYCEITLTKGQSAIVDANRYDELAMFKWMAQPCSNGRGYYAVRHIYQKDEKYSIMMHRVILGLKREDERQADHINHNTLDNRLINLRAVTREVNQWNRLINVNSSSGVTGVVKHKGRWRAEIGVNGKRFRLGSVRHDK